MGEIARNTSLGPWPYRVCTLANHVTSDPPTLDPNVGQHTDTSGDTAQAAGNLASGIAWWCLRVMCKGTSRHKLDTHRQEQRP